MHSSLMMQMSQMNRAPQIIPVIGGGGGSGQSTLGQVLTAVPGIVGAVSSVGKSCSIF
jgi:hypothetical protein